MQDDLGDRMKEYEVIETGRRFIPGLPIYARIDGRGFSKFTKGMRRPYDERMSDCMIQTVSALVDHTHALIGFTQSDEISLVWLTENPESEIFFNGKIQKMTSVLAGYATAAFTRAVLTHADTDFRAYAEKMPHFDCRVFQLPSKIEATNAFVWRSKDARRNAVLMAAQHVIGHKRTQHKKVTELIEMLKDDGVDFEKDFPDFFKNGTFVRRVTELRSLSDAEMAKIPEKKRPEPGHQFERSSVKKIDMPFFPSMAARTAFIFGAEEPTE